MENPFELILNRLESIENLLRETRQPIVMAGSDQRRTMTIDEFCEFTGFSKQFAYKLTSSNRIPFSKQGRRIWFDRHDVEKWLLENRHLTNLEVEEMAIRYISQSAPKKRRIV